MVNIYFASYELTNVHSAKQFPQLSEKQIHFYNGEGLLIQSVKVKKEAWEALRFSVLT